MSKYEGLEEKLCCQRSHKCTSSNMGTFVIINIFRDARSEGQVYQEMRREIGWKDQFLSIIDLVHTVIDLVHTVIDLEHTWIFILNRNDTRF